ncbi:MAG: hypothetical protein WCC04_06120 [Terriglobales bacterium]
MERPSTLTAVSKLAIAGEQGGFSVEQMIQLLNAGLSVETLLQLIAQRLDGNGLGSETSFSRSSRWII